MGKKSSKKGSTKSSKKKITTNRIKNAVKNVANKVKNAVKNVANKVKSKVKSTVSKVGRSVKSNVSKLGSIGKKISAGAVKGLSKVGSALGGTPKGLKMSLRNVTSKNVSKLGKITTPPPSTKITMRSRMEAENRKMFGDDKINKLKIQNQSFQKARGDKAAMAAHEAKYRDVLMSGAERAKELQKLKISEQLKQANKGFLDKTGAYFQNTIRDTLNTFNVKERSELQAAAAERDKDVDNQIRLTREGFQVGKDFSLNPFNKNFYSAGSTFNLSERLNPTRNPQSIFNQALQIRKAGIDSAVGLLGMVPGPQRPLIQNYFSSTRPTDPTLRNIYDVARVGYGVKNLTEATKGLLKKGSNWWNAGRDVRVPGENTASWRKLWGDDFAQIGKFKDAAGNLESGLFGSGIPKNFNQLGQFIQGKGGHAWSATRGVPTGPTAAVRQAVERPLRAINSRLPGIGNTLNTINRLTPSGRTSAIGIGLGLGAGALKVGGGILQAGFSPEAKLKTGIDIAKHPWTQTAAQWMGGESALQRAAAHYTSNTLEHYLNPVMDKAKDVKGFAGIGARIQAGKLDRRLEADNIPGALKTITGTYDLATRYGENQPGILAELGGRWTQAGQLLNNKPVQSVREIYTGKQDAVSQTRREAVSIARNTRSGGNNNRFTIRDSDLNKIGVGANPYLQAQAATDESDLAAFWAHQDKINRAAEQRLLDIRSDRSQYASLIDQIGQYRRSYDDEITRIQPIGQEYTSELARIKPIGQEYTSELARLKPFDQEFISDLAALRKDQKYLQSFDLRLDEDEGGLDYQDAKYVRESLPKFRDAISNLEKQYSEYKTTISDLTGMQKEYQDYFGELTGKQKEYQDYLGELQGEQKELSSYFTDVSARRKEFEDYATAFGSAKAASDAAAKSYTIASQQSIAGGFRPGVSGIRSAKGYLTVGDKRTRSAKKRFNRDFRIGSFGDTSSPPINI